MSISLISKAKSRAKSAKHLFEKLNSVQNFDDFSDTWHQFLIKLNGVHSQLSAASRKSKTLSKWYNPKKIVWRKDPLLQYLLQARNADEHGIGEVLEKASASMELKSRNPDEDRTIGASLTFVNGVPYGQVWSNDHHGVSASFKPPRIILIPVTDDRFGTTFTPPKEHLGKAISSDDPRYVARLGLNYTLSLLDEAEAISKNMA